MTSQALLALLRFETPGYLALLATLPLLIVLSFRSLAGLGPARRGLAILARCLVVTCAVLALSGAQRVKTSDELSVIFLIDRSNSIPRSIQAGAFDILKAARDAMRPTKDRIGVVAFDGQTAVEQLPMGDLGITRLGDAVNPDETNIAQALRMAAALFTDDVMRRIVLVSDGNENVGDALAEAEQLGATGIPIDVAPLRYEHRNEVVFERMSAPPTASQEETVNLQMIVRSQQPVSGRILLWHNDRAIDLDPKDPQSSGYPVKLDAGPNRLTIPTPLRDVGAHRFRAVFQPDDASLDTLPGNNEARSFTVVAGEGRILILTTERDQPSAEILRRALESERLTCDLEIAGQQPLVQERLLDYSLVILSNVPADYVPQEEQKALAVFVRELGGGLIMIGGDESFGAGGWMGSPIEEVMPVSFDVKSMRQIPKGALVLAMHACEIPQGNYWGERVAIETVKTLSSRDLVGVLSYRWRGGDDGYWDVPLQTVGSKTAVIQKIKRMDMGDMPDLDAVMRPGVEALIARPDAAAKHMIVISDFDPMPPRDDLIAMMKQNGITCSTVAIGWGGHAIDMNKATWIARETGGKVYSTRDYRQLPQIFIKEARIVRRSLINETTFVPQRAESVSTLIAGIDELPPLGGYVLTTRRPLAEMPLARGTEEGPDPLLANWQVGLGKTVAFTSGMWPRWGANWAASPQFSKIWAQIARWAARQSDTANLDITTSVEGGKARIRVDAMDVGAKSLNFASIEGVLVTPDAEPRRVALTQTGPGRYEGEFDARSPGSYVINLNCRTADGTTRSLRTGLSVAYSPEYRELTGNDGFLTQLADRTAGRRVELSAAGAAFDISGLRRAESRQPIWEDLVRLLLVLFLLDVAVRRIAVHPRELAARFRRFIAEIAGTRRAGEASAAVLSTLKGARSEVREGLTRPAAGEAGPAPNRAARFEAPTPDARVAEQLSKALGGASEADAPVVARPTRKPAATTEADYTSRLLKAKRRARDEMQAGEGDEAKSG